MLPMHRSGTASKVQTITIATLVMLCVLLAACSSNKQQPPVKSKNEPYNPNDGRYSHNKDFGPDKDVDLSHIPDAVPRYETRTIAGNKNPYTVLGKTYHLIEDESAYRERGNASWY